MCQGQTLISFLEAVQRKVNHGSIALHLHLYELCVNKKIIIKKQISPIQGNIRREHVHMFTVKVKHKWNQPAIDTCMFLPQA